MKRAISLTVVCAAILFLLCSCVGKTYESATSADGVVEKTVDNSVYGEKLLLEIDGKRLDVSWEDNASVAALRRLAENGLSVSMHKYGGFEQVGPLGSTIVSDDEEITPVAGDIVLYASDHIVLFYGTNTWSYTKLGHIELSRSELTDLLGGRDVTVLLSTE